MNTTSPVFLSNKVLSPTPKMQNKTNNELAELTPELYEEILKYYENQNVYFPL